MWCKNVGTSSFRFCHKARLTDGWTERAWQYRVLHYMQSHGKN